MRFVALEEKTAKRPSPLTAWGVELLGPFAAAPPAAMDTVDVEGVQPLAGPLDELHVSWIKTMLVMPPPDSGTCELNTTKRPSSLIAGSWLLPASALPELSTETIVVEGAQPAEANVQVSRR